MTPTMTIKKVEGNHDVRTFTPTHLAVKRDVDTGARQLSGYAVVFNQPSQPLPFTEYIDPHAFDDVDFSEVRLLYAHDFNNILARVDSGTLSLKVDDKGLFFIADIPDTTLGNDVYTNVENGNVKGLSFNAVIDPNGGDTWDKADDGTVIHTINHFSVLNEISLTPIPAYTETSVQVARDYKEVLQDMETNKQAAVQSQAANSESTADESISRSASSATSTASAASSGNDMATLAKQFISAVTAAARSAQRDDDTDDMPDSDDVDRASSTANPGDPTSSAKSDSAESGNPGDPASSAKSGSASRAAEPTKNENDISRAAQPAKEEKENGDENHMATKLNDNKQSVVRDFAEYLKTGQIADSISRADNNIGLSAGSVIIPETILTPEHEQHQFPRLGSLVRTVKVSTTTGKLPVFQTSSDKLTVHTEFQPSQRHAAPEIKPINWDLKTYTGNYAFSQDLLSDSSYNWQSELSSRLQELKDNTNDDLIINALTNGVTAKNATNLINDIKDALDSGLKPQDSQAASIILSQAAFAALDKMTDGEGRPLVQPNVTQSTGKTILGKTVVVVDDQLFPQANAGDANIIIAPLQKAVINFQNNEITGQFIDSYDVWYKILGIYLREDVVQARQDLITWISSKGTTAPATDNSKK